MKPDPKKPRISILNAAFKYTPSAETDLKKRFAAERASWAKHRKDIINNVAPIRKEKP